mmetsp:Transcript_20042/g.43124  ORF Transcript_20042/g.43124 Transcript_20042/m.43124 type:complete len:318 (+) Transcript_20042:95-1048(+)
MAELDQSGFSAVDAFFGADRSGKSTSQNVESSTTRNTRPSSGKRLGVGASTTEAAASPTGNALHKRVLQVGRKRGRQEVTNEEEEEEDEVGDTIDAPDNDDSDEDEAAGRTSIATAKPAVGSNPAAHMKTKSKKKKKKGKKEREKEKGTTTTTSSLETNIAATTESVPATNDTTTTEAIRKQKRKRPKIRSRQKNIRKDNREKKPDHLVVGSTNYQGRPLTEQTRHRLNLAPSKASAKLASVAQSVVVDKEESPPNDTTTNTMEMDMNTEKPTSAEDQPSPETTGKGGVEEEVVLSKQGPPKAKKRRRKSKFKNLTF